MIKLLFDNKHYNTAGHAHELTIPVIEDYQEPALKCQAHR